MDEARMVAQQITVKIANGWVIGSEATKRDLELLWHCERQAAGFGVTLAAAIDEWVSARSVVKGIPLSDAVRFYQANRIDLNGARSLTQVADEFVKSRAASGVSAAYVSGCQDTLRRFCEKVKGNIGDVKTADINNYLAGMKGLGPVTRNCHRRNIVTMFSFAKKQGYLHPDRKTSDELSETFKVPETEITIFTPAEIERLLLDCHARLLPVIAIGAFAGIRTAEIMRLDWEDFKWDRGHIEIAGRKAKTAARRLVPLPENLKAWLAPWHEKTGRIVTLTAVAGAMNDLAVKAQIPGGWRQNALRHSFISYRVALTGDVARTALEAGNSAKMIFRHYREVVEAQTAESWFAITPPEGWQPSGLDWALRNRWKKLALRRQHGA
jgi:integrase